MKYMTFNSSCSYAALANMLEQYGVDTTDSSIALTMKLPYLFHYCDGTYLSGPMLQNAVWFDLYLNPIGFRLVEKVMPAEEVADYLKAQKTAMIGIRMGAAGKHAVVYTGTESDLLVFLNNKRENEESPDQISMTADELKQRIDDEAAVAVLESIPPKKVGLRNKLQNSAAVLQENLAEIISLCQREETVEALRLKLNTLFRPLFLDAIAMLDLIGERALSHDFAVLQSELLRALRQESGKSVALKEYVTLDKLKASAERYVDLIKLAMEETNDEERC